MKVGDPFKPFTPAGGAPAKAAKLVEQGVESLVDGAGKLLRGDAARTVDTFEKATAPALQGMLDAGRAGLAGGAATARSAGAALSEAGARLLGGLGGQLGRAESETRSLMRRIDELRTGSTAAEGTAQRGADLATSILDSLAVAADALAQAQELVAAESFLESTAGIAGRVVRGKLERDAGAAHSAGEDLAATGRRAVADLREELARVENQIQLILGQIEEQRSREAAEQDAAQAGAGDDPVAAAAQRASDAFAAIRDALDLRP